MATETLTRFRRRVNRDIRKSVGLSKEPPPRCNDPDEAYFALDGVARTIHGDLPPMLVGGLGSLFIQMLHPHTMAGVAQHSRYREDPLGRLLHTANFIGFTTYGTKAQAYASIERVLAVHQVVRGVADDGAPVLRERSPPAGVGARRRDVDVPRRLSKVRCGAPQRR